MTGTDTIPRARIRASSLNTLLNALNFLGYMTMLDEHPMNTAPCMKKQWKSTFRPIYRPSFRLRGSLTFSLIDPLLVSVVLWPVVLTTFGFFLATMVMLRPVTLCFTCCVVPQLGLACGAWVELNMSIVGLSLVSVLNLLMNLDRTCSICYGLTRS